MNPKSKEKIFPRQAEKSIKDALFKGKIVVVYGARQVGKTTLVKKILSDLPAVRSLYINCDEGDYRQLLQDAETSTALKQVVGDYPLVVIDEAQRIKDIGLKLKLLVDNFPEQQIVATGSSSFDLSNEIVEPLTGRSFEFWIYPLSVPELLGQMPTIEINRRLESLLIFGSYPAVVAASSLKEKKRLIGEIAENYLYKDVLKFNDLKSADLVRKLLTALALQIGSEVSYNELAQLLGVNRKTIESYVEVLEKAFVLFKIGPLSRNRRKELSKLRKIYFYDLGVRNALLRSQTPLRLREDVGRLWENFIVSEWKKKEISLVGSQKLYFWRTLTKQEVDLVVEDSSRLRGLEIKWSGKKGRPPKAWRDLYPGAVWSAINRDNFLEFLRR